MLQTNHLNEKKKGRVVQLSGRESPQVGVTLYIDLHDCIPMYLRCSQKTPKYTGLVINILNTTLNASIGMSSIDCVIDWLTDNFSD